MGFFELNLSTVQTTRSTTTYLSPEDFLVTILKGSDTIRHTTRMGDLDTRLPAGYGYTIHAESCSETEAETADNGWGQKRFAGFSASFAIKAGATTQVDVGCSMANSGVQLFLEELTLSYFTSVQAVVKSGDRTLTITQAENGKIAFFNLPPDGERTVTYTITGTVEGEDEPIVSEGTFTLDKAIVSRIKMNYDLGVLGLSIYVEKVTIEDAEVIIYDKDLKTDEGKTDINAAFGGYTEGSKADISAYGQTPVSLTTTTPIDWSTGDNQVAVYDYTKENKEAFAVSDIDGTQRLTGNVTPKTRDFLAAYPYSQVADALSDGKVLFTLPAEQRATAVAPGTKLTSSNINYSVAKGQRNYDGSLLNMTFQPVCQMLQFQVPDYATGRIKAIQLTTNTAATGQLTVDCSGEKPATSITANGSNSLTIMPPSGTTFAAGTYYILTAPVQFSGFTMSFQCEGTGYTLSSTSTIGGKAGKVYPLGYIDLVNCVSVSDVGHVYESGVLKGTSFKVNIPIPTLNWTATTKNASYTTVRSYNGTSDFISTFSDASWPYLPNGTYTVDYSYTTSNGKPMSGQLSFSTTKPNNFTVTTTAYTSYSYYIGDVVSKNITSANACANNTIYAPTVTISGISNAILNNNNYTFTINRTGFSSNQKSAKDGVYVYNDFTQTEWKAYELSSSVTFDGVTINSNKKTVHLTGLPYSVAPPKNSGDHAWSVTGGSNKVNFTESYVSMGDGGTAWDNKDPAIQSPSFYVPANINVNIGSTGTIYTRNVLFDYTCTLTMYLAGNSIWSQKSSSTSGNNYTANVTDKTLTTSNNYIRLSTDTRTELSGYAHIKTVSVTYR